MPHKIINYFSLLMLASSFLFSSLQSQENKANRDCPFCNPEVIDVQKFYEDELVLVFYTHKPIFPGHLLIIPKRHVERFEELFDEEILQVSRVIKKVNKAAEKVFGTSSYLILQKNGKEVGQSVPHVHFHYIPRQTGDDSTILFLVNMYLAEFRGPISPDEMQKVVKKMKIAMEN